MNLIAGIDEVGTENLVSDGWTYCLLEKTGLARIECAVSGRKLPHFHGKTFKADQSDDYRTLLLATRAQLAKSDASRLIFTLNERTWKNEFVPAIQQLISQTMNNVGMEGLTAPQCETILKRVFPRLATFQRLTRHLGAGREVEIQLDAENTTEPLNALTVAIQGHEIPAARLLTRAYNGYRKVNFPASPPLALDGLHIVPDGDSLPVQIADVFGHFAQCYLYKQLGCTKKRRAVKADLFHEVFGDLLGNEDYTKKARLVGDNDIEILTTGALTLSIGLV